MTISVIIPVYREQGIALLLDDLLDRPDLGPAEIIVVDGAPGADTLARISRTEVLGLTSPPGRGAQQNMGAAAARGDVLLFLHADTKLPPDALGLLRRAMRDPGLAGGAFCLGYDQAGRALRFIAAAANLRSRLTRVPYGDQAIFIRRTVFKELGGFRDWPLMEDLEFMTRLRQRRGRIRILDAAVLTSARRQRSEGLLHCTLRNLCLRLLYHLGLHPTRLVRLYRRHGD